MHLLQTSVIFMICINVFLLSALPTRRRERYLRTSRQSTRGGGSFQQKGISVPRTRLAERSSRYSNPYRKPRAQYEDPYRSPRAQTRDPSSWQMVSQQRRQARQPDIYDRPPVDYRDYKSSQYNPRPRRYRDRDFGVAPSYQDQYSQPTYREPVYSDGYMQPLHRTFHNQPVYDADAQADLADAMADRRNTLQELRNPDPPPPRSNHIDSTAFNQRRSSMEQLGLDPAISSSIQSLARTLGADTISVSQHVQDSPATDAQPQPITKDTLYNDFLAFMAQRLRERRTKGQTHGATNSMWNDSSLIEPDTDHLEVSTVNPNTNKSLHTKENALLGTQQREVIANSAAENASAYSGQTSDRKLEQKTPTLDRTIDFESKLTSVTGPETSKASDKIEVSKGMKSNKFDGKLKEVKPSISQGKNDVFVEVPITRAPKLQEKTFRNLYILPNMSSLSNLAALFSKHPVSKTPNNTPKFVLVMVDNQGLLRPVQQYPALMEMKENVQTNKVKQTQSKHLINANRKQNTNLSNEGETVLNALSQRIDKEHTSNVPSEINELNSKKFPNDTYKSTSDKLMSEAKSIIQNLAESNTITKGTKEINISSGKSNKTKTKQSSAKEKDVGVQKPATNDSPNPKRSASKPQDPSSAVSSGEHSAQGRMGHPVEAPDLPDVDVITTTNATPESTKQVLRKAKKIDIEALQANAERQLALWNSAMEGMDFASLFKK